MLHMEKSTHTHTHTCWAWMRAVCLYTFSRNFRDAVTHTRVFIFSFGFHFELAQKLFTGDPSSQSRRHSGTAWRSCMFLTLLICCSITRDKELHSLVVTFRSHHKARVIAKRRAVQTPRSARVCLIQVNINCLEINCYFNTAGTSNYLELFFFFWVFVRVWPWSEIACGFA